MRLGPGSSGCLPHRRRSRASRYDLAEQIGFDTPRRNGRRHAEPRATRKPDPDLVARNPVHTLAQLIELNSLPTTAQDAEPAMPFGERVLARLADAGYALRNVADDQGTRCVRQDRSPSRSGSGERLRYRVAIGSIAVARDFDVLDGQTVPRPVQVIEGTRSESRAAVTTVGSRRVGMARGVGTSAAPTPTGAFVRGSRRRTSATGRRVRPHPRGGTASGDPGRSRRRARGFRVRDIRDTQGAWPRHRVER